jgi:hypothetical protein
MTDTGIPRRIWFVVRITPSTSVVQVVKQFDDPSRGLGDAQDYQRQHGGYVIEALDWQFFDDEKGGE